jgi:uncharacterized membrane protein YdfJ with MMPL/SSD domain
MLMFLFAAMLCISMMGFAQSTDTYSQSSGQQPAAAPAGSADHGHMQMDPQEFVSHLDQQLTLTADQKTKITTIVENSNKHAQELMSANSGDKKANHEAMKQLHENTHAQIRATLNPDQQTKFDAMMKEQMSKHQKTTSTTTTTNSTTESPK